MAEFQEVIKQFHRMCKFYQSKRSCPMECPMSGVNISQCRKQLVDAYVDAECTVMKWASENPETIYPSVAEYLKQFGIIIRRDGSLEADFFEADKPMSADKAKLLGIEPKVVKWDE